MLFLTPAEEPRSYWVKYPQMQCFKMPLYLKAIIKDKRSTLRKGKLQPLFHL